MLAYRELDDVLGLTSATEPDLCDIRTGKNTQHGLATLLRQSIYSRLADYDDTNDAERLALDPAMRHVAGSRAVERSAASTSVMSRFETETLTQPKNLEFLMNLPGTRVDRVHKGSPPKQITLDMDSSVSPTYGCQEGSAYNGYFKCTCYHPGFWNGGERWRCANTEGKVDSSRKYVAFLVFNATWGAGFLGN